jgi:hypothetical protein
MYTQPLQLIFEHHDITYHKYADDIQLYCPYKPDNTQSRLAAINRIQQCITDTKQWMMTNCLMLNESKTEVVNLMSTHQLRVFGHQSVVIDEVTIRPANTARNLGVWFDQHLSMTQQVSNVVKMCNYHIRNIGRVRKHLTTDATKTAFQSVVVPCLDYCSTLFGDLSNQDLRRLQVVQNKAARIISRTPYRNHITPVLQNLHWLPCASRVKFRILMSVFKCLKNLMPQYLCDLVQPYVPKRSLRSADRSLLVLPIPKKRIGLQAFQFIGPKLWNDLPLNIRQCQSLHSFKKLLKTHLFAGHYNI